MKEIEIWDFRSPKYRHPKAVDWITQAALGAIIGEWMLGKRLGKQAMAWGALLGIFPDLDIILSLPFSTGFQLAFRQSFSHSIWLLPFIAFGLGHLLEKHWKLYKISRMHAAGFAMLAMSAHVFLECLTADGAAVLWPFLSNRISLGLLFWVDPLFSLILIITVVRLLILPIKTESKARRKTLPPPSSRRRACLYGLGIGTSYLCLSLGLKLLVASGFESDLGQRPTSYQKMITAPASSNLFFWRAVVARENEFWVGYRSIFENPKSKVRWTLYPQNKAALAGLEEKFEVRTLFRVTDGWWLARAHSKGTWIGDIRHSEVRNWGDKKGMVDSRLAHSWVFNPNGENHKLRLIDEAWRNSKEMRRRMFARIFGNHAEWEANPRLAGVPGSLPEFLPAEE